jgi:mono/diheme cytochrome c family protein
MSKLIFAAALAAGALACFPLIMQAAAEGDERVAPVKDPVVIKECGACHMVYQPGFLPARSWQKMAEGLKDHFGENAELDEATTKRIAEYLTANAGDRGLFQSWATRGLSASDTPLRVSETPWFVREHEKHGRISPAALQRARAKSKSDCAACHPGASKGYYEDD